MKYTEDYIKKSVGILIKKERKKLGLTQEGLANELKIEPKTLSKVETGKVFISAYLLTKLANRFDMTPDEFFKFGAVAACHDNEQKLFAINDILNNIDTCTLDVVYKMIRALKYSE